MTEQTIKCPYCKKDIPLTEALTHQIQEKVRNELEIELREKEQNLEEKEKELLKRIKAVENSQKTVEEEVVKRVEAEKEKLTQEAKQKAEEKLSLELKDLQEQIKEKNKEIEVAQKKELELRKRQREIEGREKNLELEMTRKIDEERKKIEEETARKTIEEQRLKFLEKEKTIEDLKKQIGELKRRAEQGSQQLQGEVQELDLETFLKEHFIFDDIQPVPKGVRGADVLQKVYTKKETPCGIILWETKRTKNWVEGWITKLKEDQREAKADIAAIVSDILPKDISNFGFRNGVWITNRSSLLGLAFALRTTLTQVAFTKLAAEGKDEKIELLFRYLTGPEFRQRVEAMIETFIAMKQELDKEKRTTMARWGKQEKQIERVIAITSGMHGDLKGLIGTSMQSIPALESGDEEITNAENTKTEDEEDNEVDVKDIPF